MTEIFWEVTDRDKLIEYVRKSLGCLEKLRQVEGVLKNDKQICSILENELKDNLISDCSNNDEYLLWLCGTLERLSPDIWLPLKATILSTLCDVNFTAGASLMNLALSSNILTKEDVLEKINVLPTNLILQTLRCYRDETFIFEAAQSLEDESKLIVFLVHCLHFDAELLSRYIADESRFQRLNLALIKYQASHDASFRKFSLALLRVMLEVRCMDRSGLIVNMLTNAEEKQIHLIEPVLNLFVAAVRSGELNEVDWTLLVFQRLFNHQTSWVRVQTLRHFLDLADFHVKVFSANRQQFYWTSFLNALDNLALYSRAEHSGYGSPSPIGRALSEWLKYIQRSVDGEIFQEFLVKFIQSICGRIEWNSVALLYISEAIAGLKKESIFESTQCVQTALNLWTFQEPLLRRITCRLWLQIAFDFSKDPTTSDQLIQMCSSFIDDIDVVKDYIFPLEISDAISPVGLYAACTEPSRLNSVIENRISNPECWQSLAKIKHSPFVWPVIKDELERHEEWLEIALKSLVSRQYNDAVNEAIVDVLADCTLPKQMIDKEMQGQISWPIAYLLSINEETETKTMLNILSRVDVRDDYTKLFATIDAKYMFLTLANIGKNQSAIQQSSVDFVEFSCVLLPLAPLAMTIYLLQVLLVGLDQAKNNDLGRTLRLAWLSCLETRKATTTFVNCVETFLKVLFHPVMFDNDGDTVQAMLDELDDFVGAMPWFGEMFYLTMIAFLKSYPQYRQMLSGEIAKALCYGPTFRKDQKIVLDTERYLLTKWDYADLHLLSECESAVNVRARSVSYAKQLEPNGIIEIIEAVRIHEKAVSSTRKRYFNNSNIHRVKTRAWQVILVLLSRLDSESPNILDDILDQLMNDSHQLTVRIFMEWCAVKILITNNVDAVATMSMAILKASSERIGCICSYLNILLHYCCAKKDCVLVGRTLPLLLPWMMSQHYAVRLHSQFVFKRLATSCRCDDSCHSQYAAQLNALAQVVNYGGGSKNAAKLDKDSYMAEFVLTECETYDLVFDKIPRAYGLTDVDSVPKELFDSDSWSIDSEKEVKTDFMLGIIDENSIRPDETAVVQSDNYQRKIVPVLTLLEEDRHPVVDKDQLIVVASLIDRLPNLGGLSRTCEIFGVSELTLPNVKLLEMKDFQNLSVSSHQWLPIRGVGPSAVEDYLREKKKDGYTLVGVEQTAQSVSLETFKFPKKTLLLLGNEKEGMPLHLIHLMDACVEIPQQGVVRSLNVHVSAAILIWEYRKQYLT